MRVAFLLSPARTDGVRAGMLLNPKAEFALAVGLRGPGISLADTFTFASGLYFRGKIAYARRFAGKADLVRVITTNAGLVDPERIVTTRDLKAFAAVAIDAQEEKYLRPLRRDAQKIAEELGPEGRAVLLGSIATGKYRDILLKIFGPRLLFPADFVGRGDMSRGALMLHAAKAGTPLEYVPVEGAVVKGKRAGSFRAVKLDSASRGSGI